MTSAKVIGLTKCIVGNDDSGLNVVKIACSKPYGKSIGDKALNRIIDSGHLSVLEHYYINLEVKCSVRVLGQLTRHRHLSFTVASARGRQFTDLYLPDQLKEALMDDGSYIEGFIEDMLKPYNNALKRGLPYEDAAYLLPQGVMTDMVVSGNVRTWYEWLPKRLCRRAMPEHRELARTILQALKEVEPFLFNKNFMNCKNCTEKSCEFK